MTTPGEVGPPGGAPQPSAADEPQHRTVTSRPRLTPEEVRNRAFKRATRGVSEAEVRNFLHRIAEELDRGLAHEHHLELRVRALEEQLRNPPPVTEDELLDALGAETASVLRAAQHAAAEVREKAGSASATALAEAERAARELRDDAEAFVAQCRREGEELSARLRGEAEALASELKEEAERQAVGMRERASAEADATIEGARDEGRGMVAEAKAVRERVLTDLARRRRSLQAQLEELREGRDRLLEGYRVVRRTLGEATEALGAPPPAEHDLDLEALSADEPERVDPELDAALSEVADVDLEPDPASGAGEARAVEVGEVAPAPEGDEEAAPVGRGLRGYVKEALGIGSAEDDADAGAEDDGDDDGDGDAPAGVPEAAAEPAEEHGRRDPSAVFADLRAGRGDRGGETEGAASRGEPAAAEVESAAEPDGARAGADRGPRGSESEEASTDDAGALEGDAALVAARDEALAPARAAMARAVKREAQDAQNELLDALRRAKRRKDLLPLLGERDEVVADFAEVIRPAVAEAYGGEPPGELVAELASALVHPLYDRLAESLAEGGDGEALTQRVGARYREWRSQELEAAVDAALAAAQARATYEATAPGTALRWVPARPGRCPDCDDNALEPTARGETFPTGQAFPPAHPGCRCLLVVDA